MAAAAKAITSLAAGAALAAVGLLAAGLLVAALGAAFPALPAAAALPAGPIAAASSAIPAAPAFPVGPSAAAVGARSPAAPAAVSTGLRARAAATGARAVADDQPGHAAYSYMAALSDGIGRRIAGSANERRAALSIRDSFVALGYLPIVQLFRADDGERIITSRNVVAVKAGASEKIIVIGAHYDSVSVGRGAFDNASGVGLLLALAARLQPQATPYTIVFAAFGSEEVEYNGSRAYWRRLSSGQKADVLLMINFDSVAGGDQWCVYSGLGKKAWPRRLLQRLAPSLGLTLLTNPGLNEDYPYGTTGDWSDHVVFKRAGVPFAYFETTNWRIGAQDGDLNTADNGKIWHTRKDTVSWIEAHYPGRMERQLQDSAVVLLRFLTQPIMDF
jgi:alkaline phosphatase isozyme conversion protein